jgi:hypothetical protein
MTSFQCKELLPAITHFANGGNLWYYNGKKWKQQDHFVIQAYVDKPERIFNIIEDSNFEARKAYALGEEIEYQNPENMLWQKVESNTQVFSDWINYRPITKKIYEWQYVLIINGKIVDYTNGFYTEEVGADWVKFEPSKRIRNGNV